MIYLHRKQLNEDLIHYWANESESADDEHAVYKIKQLETGEIYNEAIDIIPCLFTYEPTDTPVDIPEDEDPTCDIDPEDLPIVEMTEEEIAEAENDI